MKLEKAAKVIIIILILKNSNKILIFNYLGRNR
jgi:hypothetical protein